MPLIFSMTVCIVVAIAVGVVVYMAVTGKFNSSSSNNNSNSNSNSGTTSSSPTPTSNTPPATTSSTTSAPGRIRRSLFGSRSVVDDVHMEGRDAPTLHSNEEGAGGGRARGLRRRMVVPGAEWEGEDGQRGKRAVVPGVEWKGEDEQDTKQRAVVPGEEWTPDVGTGGKWAVPKRRFARRNGLAASPLAKPPSIP